MTLEQLLATFPTVTAALARRLIDHIEAAADWKEMRVYPGWRGVGFHHPDHGYVVGVFPRDEEVRVLFEHGDQLGTAPYLEGKKQTRFIRFSAFEAARVSAVDEMIDRALVP